MAANKLANGKDQVDEGHEHSRRRGCSCFSIGIYGFFLLVALAVLGLLYLERKLIQNGLDQLKPAEVADYQRWVDAPMDLPPDALAVKPELPTPLIKERETVFREGKIYHERNIPVLETANPQLIKLMRSGRTLTSDQLNDVTSATNTFQPLFARAKALFDDPDYLINSRTFPVGTNTPYLNLYMTMRALETFALRQLYTGDVAGMVETLDGLIAMNRRDQYPGFMYTVIAYDTGERVARIANLFGRRETSETAYLKNLLTLMTTQRDPLYGTSDIAVYMGDYLPLVAQMNADGYTTHSSFTPRMLMNYGIYGEEDYLTWLDKNLPPGSARRTGLQRRLTELRSRPKGKLGVGEAIQQSPLKFVLRRMQRASLEGFLVSHWRTSRGFHNRWASSRLNYDTARLSLAQRIAELKGEPVPVKPEDFVPRYMPEFPRDAITGDPITVPAPGAWDTGADSETTSTAVAGSE